MRKLPDDFTLSMYGLDVRLIAKEDAAFVSEIRNDKELNKYLNEITVYVDDQISWIKNYKLREKEGREYYFIYEYNGKPIGLNRMKNICSNSWMGASLIFMKNSPPGSAIIGSMIHYYIGFEVLDLSVHFGDVLKSNLAAIRFNRFFGVDFIHEDEKYKYMILTKETYIKIREKFKVKL